MTASSGTPTRMPNLNAGTMSAAQRAVHDRIASGPRGAVVGPLRVWLSSPELADRAQALGQYVRYDSALSPRLSELAILVTARIWSAGFEWAHHAPLALKAGVAAEAIDLIAQARRPSFPDVDSAAVFDFAVELQRDRQISDATFAAAKAAVGEAAVVDLVGICGYYGLISMTINAFHVPDGDGPVLPEVTAPNSDYFRA